MFSLCVVYLTYIVFIFFLLPTLTLGEEQALLFFLAGFFCILYSYSPANSLFLLEASQSMNLLYSCICSLANTAGP